MNIVKLIYQNISHSFFVFWKELALPRRVIIRKGLFTIKAWLFVVFFLTHSLLVETSCNINFLSSTSRDVSTQNSTNLLLGGNQARRYGKE